MMQGYQYELRYRSGQENQNADCLSRLPCEVNVLDAPVLEERVHVMETLRRFAAVSSFYVLTEWRKEISLASSSKFNSLF